MILISNWGFVCYESEAHPDVIEADGLATPESYQSDLAYLKKKVQICVLVLNFVC